MHGATRLILHRFGHKGGVTIVAKRRLPDHPFKVKHLISQLERVAMNEVDLDLARAAFLNDGVNLVTLRLGKIIDIVDHFAVIIYRDH